MDDLIKLKNKVLNKELLEQREAMYLYDAPLDWLCNSADEIRRYFCGDGFDICTIINGKSGCCSENCKYCAQSVHYNTNIMEYSILGTDEIIKQAKYNEERGVLRYSIVTSGRTLDDAEVDHVCKSVEAIKKESGIDVCVSLGLLTKEQFIRLKTAGVTRIHNNIETSKKYFENVCTTHTFEDKIAAIKAARSAGLDVCSGGIMGLGESTEDRIDMALTLRWLGVKSIPVNLLNPIPGTPFENNTPLTREDMLRIVAVFRFLLPDSSIRLAGGRGLLSDKGKSCFQSGANAAISGDMLTTSGISIEADLNMIKELGYKVVKWNG